MQGLSVQIKTHRNWFRFYLIRLTIISLHNKLSCKWEMTIWTSRRYRSWWRVTTIKFNSSNCPTQKNDWLQLSRSKRQFSKNWPRLTNSPRGSLLNHFPCCWDTYYGMIMWKCTLSLWIFWSLSLETWRPTYPLLICTWWSDNSSLWSSAAKAQT